MKKIVLIALFIINNNFTIKKIISLVKLLKQIKYQNRIINDINKANMNHAYNVFNFLDKYKDDFSNLKTEEQEAIKRILEAEVKHIKNIHRKSIRNKKSF